MRYNLKDRPSQGTRHVNLGSDTGCIVSVRSDEDDHRVAFADRGSRLTLPLLGWVCFVERTVFDPVWSMDPGLFIEVVFEVAVSVELEADEYLEFATDPPVSLRRRLRCGASLDGSGGTPVCALHVAPPSDPAPTRISP